MTQQIEQDRRDGGGGVNVGEVVRAVVGGRRVLFVAWGTTGHKVAVQFKAWLMRFFGHVPPAARILAFDVDVRKEIVWIDSPGAAEGTVPVALDEDLEFVQLGRDLDVERLAVEAERSPALHPDSLALLRLQPDGRRARSLERGAEGEPLFGAIAGRWSAGTVRTALRRSLQALLHLRMAADEVASRGITVFIVGSLAGGCGAPNLLPAAKEVREVLDDIGVDPGRALIVEGAVMPEAFPEDDLRDAVTWKTLAYHATAFSQSLLPFASDRTPPGKPFDLSLLCSTVTETGNTLASVDDVASTLGLAAVVLGAYPLREAVAGAWANVVRRMEGRLPTGEPTCFSTMGIFSCRFSGAEVGDYIADRTVELFLTELLEAEPRNVEPTVKMTFSSHLADLDALMHRLLHDDEGRPLLGDLAEEAARELPRGRGADKRLIKSLQGMEKTFVRRSAQAARRAADTMSAVSGNLESALAQSFGTLIDSQGPRAGAACMERSVARLDGLVSELEGQRAALKEEVAESVAARQAAEQRIAQPAGRWRKRRRGLEDALQAYLAASVNAVNGGFALDLTGLAVESLVGLRRSCDQRLSAAKALVTSLSDLRHRSRDTQNSFKSAAARTKGVERSLHDPEAMMALFSDVLGGGWEQLPPDLSSLIVAEGGPMSSWLTAGKDDIAAILKGIAAGRLQRVCSMTADGFLAWRRERLGLNPNVFLRDALGQAAPLCRYERARLPSEDDLTGSTFHLVAVADAEGSVFNGIADVLLVNTPDKERLIFLTVRVGLPASALWRAPSYRAAYEKVKRQNQVALEYYPDYEGGFDGVTSPAKRRRRTSRASERKASRG